MSYKNRDEEVKKLVEFYKNLSYNVFKYFGMFFVFSICGLLMFKLNFNKSFAVYDNKNIKLNFLVCKKNICYSNLVWSGSKDVSGIKIKFLDKGYFYNSGNKLEYINGVAFYKDILLPFKFFGDIDSIDSIEMSLKHKGYDFKTLQNFFRVTFSGIDSIKFYVKEKRSLSKIDIGDYYNLKCIDKLKITFYFCNKTVKKFLNEGYNVDLSYGNNINYIKKLIDFYNREKVCNFLENYIKKNRYFDDEIFKVLSKCRNYKIYERWKQYSEVINSFYDKSLLLSNGSKLYDDYHVDVFKLYSFWKYFIDKLDNIDDYKDEINVYIDFLYRFVDRYYKDKDLMNKIYYFNNYILKIRLNDQSVKSVIEDFNNDDTQYLNASKLTNLVDSNLINIGKYSTFSSPETVEEIFKDYISTYYKDKIILLKKLLEKKEKKGKILVYRVLINIFYPLNGKKGEIRKWTGVIKVLFKNSNFYIIGAEGDKEYGEYNRLINEFLNNEGNVDINKFYEYLKNILEYKKIQKEKFCGKISKENYSRQFTLSKCIEKRNFVKIEIQYNLGKKEGYYRIIWHKNKGKVVIYTNNILFKKRYGLRNLKVKGKSIVFLKNNIFTEEKMLELIKSLLNSDFELREETVSSSIPIGLYFKLSNKVKQYLGGKVSKILSYKGSIVKFLLDIDNVTMIAEINLKDNYHLIVKNLLYGVGKNVKYIPVKGVNFYLIEKDYEKINQFKLDPLKYIGQIDQEAIEKYKQMFKR